MAESNKGRWVRDHRVWIQSERTTSKDREKLSSAIVTTTLQKYPSDQAYFISTVRVNGRPLYLFLPRPQLPHHHNRAPVAQKLRSSPL